MEARGEGRARVRVLIELHTLCCVLACSMLPVPRAERRKSFFFSALLLTAFSLEEDFCCFVFPCGLQGKTHLCGLRTCRYRTEIQTCCRISKCVVKPVRAREKGKRFPRLQVRCNCNSAWVAGCRARCGLLEEHALC